MMDNKLNLVVQFTALDKLSGGLKNIIGLGRSGDQALRGMKRQARDLALELKAAQAATAGATGNVTALIAKERQLEAAIAGVNAQMARQKTFNAIDGRTARVQARGQQLQASGTENMIGAATLLTPFVLAGKAAMDFGSGMVDIQQKADLTNAETAKMAGNIILAAKAAHRLPEEMRSAVDVLAGFGMDPRQAMAMIGPIGRLGTAFKVDLADGAGAAYANFNNLKIPLAETGRALDIMAAGGKAGAFEIRDMARHFPGLTAQMQALGQKGTGAVADLTAALQIARRGAGDADEAGNNIKNLLTKINSPGVIRAFQKNFGVDLPAALKQAYAQGKTPMEALAEITKKATGGDLSKLGFAVEDMQAQAGLRALILNMEDYRKIRDQIAGSGGTIDAAFKQRELRDATVAWSAFKGSMSSLAITLGTTVLPVATKFFGYLNTGIGVIGEWAQRNPELAGSLIQLVAGFAAAKIGLGVLQYALGSVIGPMGTVWGWISKFRAAGGMAMVLAKIAGGFRLAMVAVRGFNLALLANPIGLLVAGVAVAAYLIWTHWAKIKSAFVNNWTTIRNVILGGIVIFAPWLAAIIYVAKKVYDNWDAIKSATLSMLGVVGKIVEPFIRPWIRIFSFLGGLAGRFFTFGANIIGGLVNGIVSGAGAVIKAIWNLAASVGANFAKALGIKSPSVVFMQMGGHVTKGLSIGIDRGGREPLKSMRRLATGVAGAGALALAGPALAAPPGGGRPGPAAASAAAPFVLNLTINQLPGEDAEDLADRVLKKIEAALQRKRRGTFDDDF